VTVVDDVMAVSGHQVGMRLSDVVEHVTRGDALVVQAEHPHRGLVESMVDGGFIACPPLPRHSHARMWHLTQNADLPRSFKDVSGQKLLNGLDDAGRPEVRVAQE